MKKLMITAVFGMCASLAFADVAAPAGVNSDDEESGFEGGTWRMTLGGFARGGMGMRPEGFKKDHIEAYGADADFQFNLLQENDFNLWAGLGFSWAPNRNAYNKREDVDVGGATAYNIDRVQMQYGQLRLLLVPEWQATESLSLGVRLGVGLDWIRMRDRREGGLIIPGFGTFSDSGTEKFSRFGAEGIAGLQATYMFTDNFGLYANVDARMGEKVKFKKEGQRVAKLDMSGWYAGVGAIVMF